MWKAVLYAMAIRLVGGWKASISSAKLVIWKPSPRCGRRGSHASKLINVKMLKVTSVINYVSEIILRKYAYAYQRDRYFLSSRRRDKLTFFISIYGSIRTETRERKLKNEVSEVLEVFFLLLTIFCFARLILSSLYHLPYPSILSLAHLVTARN